MKNTKAHDELVEIIRDCKSSGKCFDETLATLILTRLPKRELDEEAIKNIICQEKLGGLKNGDCEDICSIANKERCSRLSKAISTGDVWKNTL